MPSPQKIIQNHKLEQWRQQIDSIDQTIIEAIAHRLALAHKIGMLKQQNKIKVRDPIREKDLKKLHQNWAKQYQLSPQTIAKLFQLLMAESRRQQSAQRQQNRPRQRKI